MGKTYWYSIIKDTVALTTHMIVDVLSLSLPFEQQPWFNVFLWYCTFKTNILSLVEFLQKLFCKGSFQKQQATNIFLGKTGFFNIGRVKNVIIYHMF